MGTYYDVQCNPITLTDDEAGHCSVIAADWSDYAAKATTHSDAVFAEQLSVKVALVLLDRTPPIVPVNANG